MYIHYTPIFLPIQVYPHYGNHSFYKAAVAQYTDSYMDGIEYIPAKTIVVKTKSANCSAAITT